jgi:hypothetical protein
LNKTNDQTYQKNSIVITIKIRRGTSVELKEKEIVAQKNSPIQKKNLENI